MREYFSYPTLGEYFSVRELGERSSGSHNYEYFAVYRLFKENSNTISFGYMDGLGCAKGSAAATQSKRFYRETRYSVQNNFNFNQNQF
ncbi:hypothetical protein CYY_000515 [Polysphondylium violaceum]|uniref:Uncharacterized protein n=1 Tax=Polysphondylium violaceum TaxID=133409 RepID=A0A8J4V2E2_9MYCE|nr:hypothetical protein CYY_000515 [Polysphondylium violaceum]